MKFTCGDIAEVKSTRDRPTDAQELLDTVSLAGCVISAATI